MLVNSIGMTSFTLLNPIIFEVQELTYRAGASYIHDCDLPVYLWRISAHTFSLLASCIQINIDLDTDQHNMKTTVD